MIGAGVYTTSGYSLSALQDPRLVLLAWVVGGIIAICGAIGYASLASRFSESGGEYLFLSKTLHPIAGVMAGWVSLLAGFTGAIAVAALSLGQYLAPMIPSMSLSDTTIAISCVGIAGILHAIGVRFAARVQDTIVIAKLLMIVAFILFAFASWDQWAGKSPQISVGMDQSPIDKVFVFAKQLVWISFSYLGFNAAIYISGEVRQPKRNVPRSMILGTICVTVIYLLLNATFVFAPSAETILQDENLPQIAAVAAQSLGGDLLETFVRIVIVVSLFTSVSALVMTGPRVYAKMAEDGFLHNWFAIHRTTPTRAILFQSAAAMFAISISTLTELLGYLGMTLSLCSALTVGTLFLLKKRGEAIWLPGKGIPALIYIAATLILAGLYGFSEPRSAIATCVTLLIGLVAYPFFNKKTVTEPQDL